MSWFGCVRIGNSVWPYLPNPTNCGHGTLWRSDIIVSSLEQTRVILKTQSIICLILPHAPAKSLVSSCWLDWEFYLSQLQIQWSTACIYVHWVWVSQQFVTSCKPHSLWLAGLFIAVTNDIQMSVFCTIPLYIEERPIFCEHNFSIIGTCLVA